MSDISLRSRFRLGDMRARQWVLLVRIVAGGAIAFFALSTPGFTSPLSINSLLNAISFIGCVAVGMTFITITGNIMSLALGATVSASALVFLASLSLGVYPAFLVAVLFGIVITAVQGALVGYIRANPLLVIAGLSLLIGGAALATGGQRIYPGGEGLQVFKGHVAGIPVETLYFFATVLIGQFVLSWTRIGREMIMVGSNLRAAIAAGINTAKTVTVAYVLAGACSAVSGVLLAARYGSGDMELGLGLRLYGDRRRAGWRHGDPGRVRFGDADIDRRDRDRHHRDSPTPARLQSAMAVPDHRHDRSCRYHAAHHRGTTMIRSLLLNPTARPFTVMAGSIVVLALIDRGTGFFFSIGTIFSVMQLFATFSLVALGLGLSILIREFDLSVAGIVGLAGCIAVMTGATNPWLGLLLGVGAGLLSGLIQGFIMTRLNLSSVGVTLGGLLTLQGMTYVLTDNKTIGYPNIAVALELNAPIGGLISVRSAACLAVFVLAASTTTYTHIGRDVIATGSDRRAARIAGLNTDRVVIGVFAASGAFSALGGVLLSYSLSAASPVALADVLATAAAAAIVGGVSVVGGRGSPMGIAAGVLTLCILRSGLSAIGVEPHVHDLVTGSILIAIAFLDAPELFRRVTSWRLARAGCNASPGE